MRPIVRQPLPPSPREQAISEAWSADPGEMAAAVFEFWLFVFAMGSSPVAWLITAGFQSVTPAMWAEFLPWVVVTFGSLFKGLSVIACAAFAGTYGPPPSTASPRLARAHARATAGSQPTHKQALRLVRGLVGKPISYMTPVRAGPRGRFPCPQHQYREWGPVRSGRGRCRKT